MSFGLHNLKPARGSQKKRKRVGRGNASGHGTYSGRGLKGQKSRSGGRKGLKLRGFRKRVLQTPKLGGFKSRRPKMEVVNLGDLEKKFSAGDIVEPRKLIEAGLIRETKNGVKVLGDGELTKKLTVKANHFSKTAKDGIIDLGGSVELISKEIKK